MFPDAPEEMKTLLKSQHDALCAKGKHSLRWSKEAIGICLSLWARSPKTFQDLCDSNTLILPSGRHLRRYKNRVSQASGLTDDMFKWMYEAAKHAKVPTYGMAGGILHDETKIQPDLVMSMEGGTPRLVGWVDTSQAGNDLRYLREGTVEQHLASQVLLV